MTISEDENQKKLYHEGKMREIHNKFEQYYHDGKISSDAMQIILRTILPDTND